MNDEVKKAWNLFLEHVQKNSEAQKLMKAVGNGKATYAEALEYSSLLSKLLVESASEIYPEDSQKVLEMLRNSQYCKNYFNHVDKYLYDLQSSLNKDSGLGMKPVKMIKYNQLLDQSVSSSDDYKADIEKYKSKAELSANKHVDTYQQYNAKTQIKAGYKVTVSRTYDGVGLSDKRVCTWCLERAKSNVLYDEAFKSGMFQRHEGCHCIIEYNNNGEKSYQTKKGGKDSWNAKKRIAIDRKNYGEYHNSPAIDLRNKWAEGVAQGWISALVSFDTYSRAYNALEIGIVGERTKDNILITGISDHFMQRLCGTSIDPKIYEEKHRIIRRSGVEPEDIIYTLLNGKSRVTVYDSNGNPSKLYISDKCKVSINPDSGILIQCNPNKQYGKNTY